MKHDHALMIHYENIGQQLHYVNLLSGGGMWGYGLDRAGSG